MRQLVRALGILGLEVPRELEITGVSESDFIVNSYYLVLRRNELTHFLIQLF